MKCMKIIHFSDQFFHVFRALNILVHHITCTAYAQCIIIIIIIITGSVVYRSPQEYFPNYCQKKKNEQKTNEEKKQCPDIAFGILRLLH